VAVLGVSGRPAIKVLLRASTFPAHTIRKHIPGLGLADALGGGLWIAREKFRDG